MGPDKYILDGHEPVPCDDLSAWARWFESADRCVADTMQDDVRVSTVFLGLDHGWNGRRHLFETMVFHGHDSVDCQRYATWDEALEGHRAMVGQLFKARPILTTPESDK